jgi:hypothetical protein
LNLEVIFAWAKQPSTITGVSALAAAAVGVASGQMTFGAAVPAVVFGVVAVLLPDNTAAWADARKLAADAVVLARPGAAVQTIPVAQDVAALSADLRAVPPPAARG